MTDEIKKYKLYYLQKRYNIYVSELNNLEAHLINLESNNIYENINDFSNNIYECIKNLNAAYNNSITLYLENNSTDIDNLIKNNSVDSMTMLKIIDEYVGCIPNNIIFNDIELDINKMIRLYGYNKLSNLFKLLYSPNYFSKTIIDLINELDDIVIPLSYNIYDTTSNELYYWRIPNKFDESDILNKKRELWVKLNKDKKYIKIELIFKIDRFSNIAKTTQLKTSFLQKHKTQILNKLEKLNVNMNFVKSFIRHDYLGNIYCMTETDYSSYLIKQYTIYTKLIELTFVNIMKDFVNQENLKKMYDIIFLLFLGNEESHDIAGLLCGLLKEKKNNKTNVNTYDIIYNNMTFYIQSKIKKSNQNIKTSLDKMKQLSIEDVDYKKQLIVSKNIPNNVKALVLEKIDEMKSNNNEYYKQLLYVKTIINYPWSSPNDDLYFESLKNNNTEAIKYLNSVEDRLNNSCYGHVDAKKLLLQIIGKWISNPSSIGSCFGLVGPPGVGKTLLAKSVSKALDIPFGQITLGGQNDGELLHGHGYTYSGAQPGMIIKKMVEMGKSRCVLYFDELDKACSKHGTINEITSILIHLTDPNMNKTFQDRFFQGVEFPLDKVIMIFSYNDSSLVDPILLDRMKEIKVQPYTMEDKLNICNKHIIPEMAEMVSMENIIKMDNNMIEYIIDNYTNEAGVREIKRKIEEIYLSMNIDMIYKKGLFAKKKKNHNLTIENITNILKPPDMMRRKINDMSEIGIINGLYATINGNGGITPIQVYPNTQHSKDKYEIKTTGKQGDTMKESVICSLTAAIEWLKHNNYDVDELMKKHVPNGFHIHTPDGATPKDGPSAGCAFTCAFISRILNRPIKNDIAMTGEIDLTGKISKIGGLEFKLQGAKKAGVTTVYVPNENEKDINEIKEKYKNLIDKDFNITLVNHINDIINEILI